MNETERKIESGERRRKTDEAQQFMEDRMQLLDTISEMIDIEFERRGMNSRGNPHPENPPPEGTGREPPDSKPPRCTLWQHIVSFFNACPPYNK